MLWLAYEDLDAVSCGTLHVPEKRADGAGGAMLQLFVLRLAAQQARGNAAVVVLAGGPGDAASASLADMLGSALRTEHELILIDQRGTGLSQPSLNCPEFASASSENPLMDCRARLVAAGIDLAAFNTAANAQDVHDLLIALGLPTVHIYGLSYGARLALALARDFPQRLRALILDGVSPPQAQLLVEQASNGQRAFEQLFADCAASPRCAQAYPDLRDSFAQVIDNLRQLPAEIVHWQSGEATWMDGEIWVNYVFGLFYDARLLPWLPALISAHAAGDYDFFPRELGEKASQTAAAPALQLPDFAMRFDEHSEGLYYSVICAEAAPFASADAVNAAGEQLSAHIDAALTRASLQTIADCRVWDVPAAPAKQMRPVVSDIPTLLFSGAYDPITPPNWAEQAAQSLGTSWRFVFPDTGHGALDKQVCARQIALTFLRQPTAGPQSDCIEALRPPDFQHE